LAIATYQDPYNLKERRQNLSLDQGPSDVILADSEGSTKAGLMTPSGTSQDPVDIAVGPQPLFEDLNDKEKQSKWELEKIGYKAKLERLTGVVASAEGNDKTIIGQNRLPEVTNKDSGDDFTVIEDKVAASLGDTKRDDLSFFPDDVARIKNFLSQVDPTKQGSRKKSLDATAEIELFRRYLAKGAPRTGSQEDIDVNKLRDSLSSLYTMQQMSTEADIPEGRGINMKVPEADIPEADIPEGRGINMKVPKADPDANDPRKGIYGDFRGTEKNAGLKESLVEPRSGNFATKGGTILYKYFNSVKHSNFKQPIVTGGLRGNSRLSHDADVEVQNKVIDLIVEESKNQDMSAKETAMILAIAYAESGFNPDAASDISSASGVGQFINETGRAFGLNDNNRWDVNAQVKALVEHTKTSYETVRKDGRPLSWVYKLHHDGLGSSNNAKQAGILNATKNVLPIYNKIVEMMLNKTGFAKPRKPYKIKAGFRTNALDMMAPQYSTKVTKSVVPKYVGSKKPLVTKKSNSTNNNRP